MTRARFKQLVYLYLDREISPRDLAALRTQLETDQRRQEFARLRRIHQAEKQAFAALDCAGAGNLTRSDLAQRAARAISEARLKFEERRKALVLFGQFSAATVAIAFTVGLIYEDSVTAYEVEDGPDARLAEGHTDIRQHLQRQLNQPLTGPRLLLDREGRAIALVSWDGAGEPQVQPLNTVSEASPLKAFAEALKAARTELPEPGIPRVAMPEDLLPGTSAPVSLAREEVGSGAVVGYAY